MNTTYSFLPWVRQGAASTIRVEDPLNGGLSAQSDLALRLRLNTADRVDVKLRLHGPADVIGIDRRQVIRTDPPPGTNNFPPSFFPAVEFDRPDFPWLFTPARAEKQQGRLRPWLCLVVVEKREGITLRPGNPLPVLDIRSPASAAEELPDLSEIWAWVHTQVGHGDGADPGDVLARDPTKNASRLLCARRLKPHAAYYACLVPTFDVGRKAALGLSVGPEDESELRPAWGSGPDAPFEIQLPVYFHWSFSTGQEGDFETVVSRLKAVELPEGIGAQLLFVGDAGVSELPDLGIFDFAGVFRPPKFDSPILPDQPEADRRKWMDRIASWLNLPDDSSRGATPDAVVTPPIYGHYQQAVQRLPEIHGWIRDLNLDARNRAAAGLGVLFVQVNQENLMASAWEQLGELRQARQLIQRTELVREVARATFVRQFAPAAQRGDLLYQMTAPSHARVLLDENQTMAGWARANALPQPTTAATFRRVARPNGPLARHFRATTLSLTGPVAIRHAVTGRPTPRAVEQSVAPVAVRAQELEQRKSAWLKGGASDQEAAGRAASAVDAVVGYMRTFGSGAKPTASGTTTPATGTLTAPTMRIRTSLSSTLKAVSSLASTDASGTPAAAEETATTAGAASVTAVSFKRKETLLQRINPEITIQRRLQTVLQPDSPTRVPAGGDGASAPVSTDLKAYPQFAEPMYEAVRELMPELILAGAHDLPEDSVTVLETNPQFIEAFMVGLNHEMARELLWRGYPTDLQSTSFKYFWGASARANLTRTPDIPDLHTWEPSTRLGGNLTGGDVAGQLALVIRGELLRRFPGTIIYAVAATPDGRLGTDEKYPLQRGVLLDDAVFLLFDLTQEEALADPGYYFVIQQQPSAPRFGLDEVAETTAPATWNDLSWPHVATSPGGYLKIAESAEAVAGAAEPGGPVWGFNGAHMANILLQRPFRLAIHARKLL